MKRLIVWVVTGCTLASPLLSQTAQVSGYFESQFMAAGVRGEMLQLGSNKCRVDLGSDMNRIQFRANINAITYHGKTTWNIADFLPDPVTRDIPEYARSMLVLPFEDDLVLDNAYMKITFSGWDLTVGKQQISMGAGYVWNPTDLFNQKDLFDPTYEQPGHNAMRADWALSSRANCTLLYGPESNPDQSTKMVLIKQGFGRFDCTLTGIEKSWTFHDYTDMTGFDPGGLSERRRLIGGSLTGELFGLGLWAEGGYNRMERSDSFYELVTGFNYTFDSQTFILAEYYRNSAAETDPGSYTLNDWMRYLAAEQKTLNRDQVTLLVQVPVTDLTQAGLNLFAAGDGSVAVLPMLNASPFENMELLAYVNLYFGRSTAMFNKNLGNGGLVRARIYF
ncbi:hypothetical protein JW948_01160 [bacterium]|nr:hypothetical protein [bacterium]